MKVFACLTVLTTLHLPSRGEPEIVVRSPHFSIEQEYSEDHGAKERIIFTSPDRDTVELAGYPWRGAHHISPDGKWLLRIQKTGSGDNIAILYSVEPNGRVSEVLGFDELIWKTSDKHSAAKRAELVHSGISETHWAPDGKSLNLTLGGSLGDGRGHSAKIVYDPAKHECRIQQKD